jgi:hypothetical protein
MELSKLERKKRNENFWKNSDLDPFEILNKLR